MLDKGIAQQCPYPFASPVILVGKRWNLEIQCGLQEIK